jgi:hypothetical protein
VAAIVMIVWEWALFAVVQEKCKDVESQPINACSVALRKLDAIASGRAVMASVTSPPAAVAQASTVLRASELVFLFSAANSSLYSSSPHYLLFTPPVTMAQ